MATRYDITHTTVYRYNQPVTFGQHRIMFRPRDSHDMRVLATDLQVSPAADIRLIQDPHSNSIALVQPRGEATELRIVCQLTIEIVPPAPDDVLALEPAAEYLPFAYSVQDRLDLDHYLRPHYDDPDGTLIQWALQFLEDGESKRTRDVLARMNAHIGKSLRYLARDDEGTQTPVQTLELGSGTCRDFALLMMEALRRLGIATRFVSGYLYDEVLDPVPPAPALPVAAIEAGDAAAGTTVATTTPNGAASAASGETPAVAAPAEPALQVAPVAGAGTTHAWLHAYLPGAGWVAFDPTNNLVGTQHLIRVGVARDPALAVPVSGSWFGEADAFDGLEATVVVHRVAAT